MSTIFEPFGIIPLTFGELVNSFSSMDSWFKILTPNVIISWLFYFTFAYGMLYVCFILPFRFFKRFIKAPDRKGKR